MSKKSRIAPVISARYKPQMRLIKNEITMTEHNWNELAQSIADGEAILVLGSDAIPFYPVQGGGGGLSFSQRTRDRIRQQLDGQISHSGCT